MAGKLVIKVNGLGHGTVELDGTDIARSVRAVEFRADANDRPEVTITLTLDEIETTWLGSAEREILVNLSDDSINTLLALGWTPPEDDRRSYRMPVTKWVTVPEFNGETSVLSAEGNYTLPAGCRCFELDHHEEYFENGTHDRQCPLFATDNASPDAND